MEIELNRNTAETIYFPLQKRGSMDLATSGDYTPVSGDIKYVKDGVQGGNPNGLPSYEGDYVWSLAVLAGEIDGKRTQLTIVDSATKAIEDQVILIKTVGDDSAAFSLNRIADFVLRRSFVNMRASSDGDTPTRSLMWGLGKWVNKVVVSGTSLQIKDEGDISNLFTQEITASPSADVITGLDTD